MLLVVAPAHGEIERSHLVPCSSGDDSATGDYTITSAGYNVWYVRDEFRYLWKTMSGDISLAANISLPNEDSFGDRKAFLLIRRSLEDDSKQALVALHGAGMIQLATRPEKGVRVRDMAFRIGIRSAIPGGNSPGSLVTNQPTRIGIEKRGNKLALFVSLNAEAMHQFGAPFEVDLEGPFYVGICMCSHLATTTDTAVIGDVVLVNAAGDFR